MRQSRRSTAFAYPAAIIVIAEASGSQRQRFRETVACLSPGDPTQTPSMQPLHSTSHSVGAPPANSNIASSVRPTESHQSSFSPDADPILSLGKEEP